MLQQQQKGPNSGPSPLVLVQLFDTVVLFFNTDHSTRTPTGGLVPNEKWYFCVHAILPVASTTRTFLRCCPRVEREEERRIAAEGTLRCILGREGGGGGEWRGVSFKGRGDGGGGGRGLA